MKKTNTNTTDNSFILTEHSPGRDQLSPLSVLLICSVVWLLFSPSLTTAVAQGGSTTNGGNQVSWPQKRYLCFSNMAVLPPIQVSVDGKVIQVGNLGNLQLQRLSILTPHEAESVAGELGVPSGLVIRLANAASESNWEAEEVARQLRVAVIDFRFLLAELTAYQPSADQEPAKRVALLRLLDGDLVSVWRFYRELPWPQAPAGLRIAGAP